MRIAYFVSNRTTLPPKGDEIAASTSVVLDLVNAFSNNHDVTVYAAKGTHIDGVKTVDLDFPPFHLDAGLSQDDWTTKFTLGMKSAYVGALFEHAAEYDLIHLHTEPVYLGMPFAHLIKTPVLFTSHNAIHDYELPLYNYYLNQGIHFSGLSHAQIRRLDNKATIPVILNGIQTDTLPFVASVASNAPYLFLGRLVVDKGIDTFLAVAKENSNTPFVVAGKGTDEWEKKTEEAQKTAQLTFLHMLIHKSKEWYQSLSQAKALLMPIQYEDTCPLVPLEAMACGTPVIAFARGALTEQVVDGKTGFLINFSENDIRGDFIIKKTGLEGMNEAIKRMSQLSQPEYALMRKDCRKHVEETFTRERMTSEYEKLYREILQK